MQISHVLPPSHLDLADYSDYDFCLAHLAIKHDSYMEFFRERRAKGRTVYMDNGVWEQGTPIEADQMIELAINIKPNYVYAPDYMNNMSKTLESIQNFGRKAQRYKEFKSKIIGVTQGNSLQEWFTCVAKLAKLPAEICHTKEL